VQLKFHTALLSLWILHGLIFKILFFYKIFILFFVAYMVVLKIQQLKWYKAKSKGLYDL